MKSNRWLWQLDERFVKINGEMIFSAGSPVHHRQHMQKAVLDRYEGDVAAPNLTGPRNCQLRCTPNPFVETCLQVLGDP